ncbi:formin-like protein 5 [Nicotiana tomentosiformis]|uniref:formin-like protein 5 n=1 Tax=Nicotiana tomentosiformis TaxID=4098 RepID=UPI00051C24B3|nr:formin-like protein 5 isoform X1 [Nicotiana tomentosiformis]XP_009630424.1 formin-like protein 5 isoform X2 [Nicotiana tomentosiformis]XP_009630425.1 formin-like protein 5 isoform X2 [Nicotiana tomentosiformis]
MLIQGQMGVRGVVHLFVVFFLLFTLVAANPGSNKDSEDYLLANLISSVEINRDMVELLWLNCRIELIRANEAVVDLEYYVAKEDSSGKDEVLLDSRSEKHKHVNVMHPLVKQALLGCLREKNLLFLICGEEKGSPNWYTKCMECLLSWHRAPKRRKLKAAPNPPPAPPNSKSSKSKDDKNSKKKSAGKGSKKTSTPGVPIIAAAAAASVLIAILCICCCCKCRGRSKKGLNDERPLLSLSSSDYSSHKSSALGASFSNHSVNKNPHDDSKIEIGRTAPAGMPPLKPPPGRMITSEAPATAASAPPPPPPPAKPSTPAPPPPPVKPIGPRPCAPGPPPPPPIKPGPRPPPPGSGPPRPPSTGLKPPRRSPAGPNASATDAEDTDASKTKLKPFFWDKVQANTDQSMVWDQVKAGSFQFDEEQIESLFGYASADKKKNGSKKESSQDASNLYIQIIDQKKAQNLSILLKALNVTTEEVCDALKEGNELPSELIQTLLKMAPTAEEELKLRLYNGDLSRLGQAERFLKALVEVPFAFKRLETLLFMCTLPDEASIIKESFSTLEAACTELRNSRLFLKLLEAVLKTGNRMNDGTFRGGAQAFKLDTLLKLSDVKGIDGKTTLLHFVVQEIIRSEGIRAARAARDQRSMSSIKSDDLLEDLPQDSEDYYRSTGLQVISGLSSDLENVKRAAILDADNLTGTVSKLGHALIKARDFLNSEMKNIDDEDGFHQTMKNFVQNAEGEVMSLLEEEKRIMALVKSTGDYFHGNAKKDEGLRLFVIVRDFLVILDKVCREVKNAPRKLNSTPKKEHVAVTTSESTLSPRPDQSTYSPRPDQRQKLFPAISDRRIDDSSSDDDTP